MFTKDSINWSEKATIEKEEFPKDTLGRVKYAQFLTQFLVDQGYDSSREEGEDKRNYVLNLNSEWGSGKTYFLKRWSDDLKPNFPVVYIDAWKQDYSDDPLMTVISSVINQLRKQADMEEDATGFKVSNKIIGLLKAAAPGFARSVAKRYFDIDPVAVMQAEEGDNLGEVKDSDGESMDMSVMASNMVKHLIDEHDAKSNAIRDLKTNIAQWIETVIAHKKLQFPAFIFIDELDRCRPSYAVEMLETIKHIFDIKGIVFVVATDTEQLQHAVKAIYGEGFDARLYLGRFFNSRFSLKAPDLKDFLEVHVEHHKLSGDYLRQAEISILPPNEDGKVTLRNIAVILDAFKMPPRTAIQITDRVIATLSNMSKGSKIDILMLTTLLCFYEENNKLFLKIVSETFEQEYTEKLTTFLHNRFHKYKSNIQIEINFKQYGGTLYYYENKVYQTPFFIYLAEIFSSHFDNGEAATFQELYTSNPYPQSFHNFIETLEDGSSESTTAISYIQVLYQMNKYVDVIPAQYQDFVELASALDWIDGDSDANDA